MSDALLLPRAVLLDWDNTLVDSFPQIHISINHTLEAMGHETWSFEKTCRTISLSMRDFFPTQYGDRWQEARDIFYASYARRDLDDIKPIPGAHDLLMALQDAGIYLALVSNKGGDNLRQEVSHLGWGDFFARTVGATDASHDKPNPAVVARALDGSGITPGIDPVWFIGDNAVDIDCALAADCIPLIVESIHHAPQNPSLDRALKRFSDCHEIAALVRNITAPGSQLL